MLDPSPVDRRKIGYVRIVAGLQLLHCLCCACACACASACACLLDPGEEARHQASVLPAKVQAFHWAILEVGWTLAKVAILFQLLVRGSRIAMAHVTMMEG